MYWQIVCLLLLSHYSVAKGDTIVRNNCTTGDIAGSYTACGNYTSKEGVLYLNTRVVQPTWAYYCNQSIPVPGSPLYGVSCNISCPPGYLQHDKQTAQNCSKCAPGSYSLGGGLLLRRFDQLDRYLFQSGVTYDTYCANSLVKGDWVQGEEVCTGWDGNNQVWTSGVFPALSYSILDLHFEIRLASGGNFSISYLAYVDSDFWDYDHLYVQFIRNGVVGDLSPLSSTVIPIYLSWYLSPGNYTARLIHHKRDDTSGFEEAPSEALVELISITGLDSFQLRCVSCDPGQYQPNDGAHECLLCEENTYQPDFGQTSCIPCPENQFALQGSAMCYNRTRECVADDMYYEYGPCLVDATTNAQYHIISYHWKSPRQCYIGNFSLPDSSRIAGCDYCENGYSWMNNTCQRCPTGYATSGNCLQCSSGSAAIPILTFDNLTSWEHLINTSGPSYNWNRHCFSFVDDYACTHNMWDVGYGNQFEAHDLIGTSFELSLQLLVELYNHANCVVSFNYQIINDRYNSALDFFVNGNQYLLSQFESVISDTTKKVQLSIPRDTSISENATRTIALDWNVRVLQGQLYNISSEFYVSNIRIVGAVGGIAPVCQRCDPGHYQPSDAVAGCFQCPKGSYQREYGSTSCIPTVQMEYAPAYASVEPLICPPYSYPNNERSTCEMDCVFTSTKTGRSYDISNLLTSPVSFIQTMDEVSTNITLSLCTRLPFADCPDTTALSNPFVCLTYQDLNKNRWDFSGGVIPNFQELPQNNSYSFVLNYTQGSTSLCSSGWYTAVWFQCDPSSATHIDLIGDMSLPCSTNLLVVSPLVCRICTPDDYIQVEMLCAHSGHTLQWVKKNSVLCRDVDLPSNLTQPVNCGEEHLDSGPWFTTPVLILIAVTVVVLACAVVLGGIYWEKILVPQQEHAAALALASSSHYEKPNVPLLSTDGSSSSNSYGSV